MIEDIDIRLYLPHKEPMLMVDRIVNMDDESVETVFAVKEDNIFIDNGSLCEAGLIENAAQTCSAIVARTCFIDEDNNHKPEANVIGFISSIKTIKIHGVPLIGNTLVTRAQLVSQFDTGAFITCMMSCKSYCNGELLLEGEINLFIQEQ